MPTSEFVQPLMRNNRIDLNPVMRGLIAASGLALTIVMAFALVKGVTGMAPTYQGAKQAAIIFHLMTVVPAVPLGAYVMLARKGTPLHKMLGKIWLALMVTTAISTLFIQHGHGFQLGWLHIFVPITLVGAYRTISAARKGDIATHKRTLIGLYLGALMIPGVFVFMPMRMMGMWLFG